MKKKMLWKLGVVLFFVALLFFGSFMVVTARDSNNDNGHVGWDPGMTTYTDRTNTGDGRNNWDPNHDSWDPGY